MGDSIALSDQIASVKREIALRQRVYPKFVRLGKLSEVKAGFELNAMQAVLDTLLNVQEGLDKDAAPENPNDR